MKPEQNWLSVGFRSTEPYVRSILNARVSGLARLLLLATEALLHLFCRASGRTGFSGLGCLAVRCGEARDRRGCLVVVCGESGFHRFLVSDVVKSFCEGFPAFR